MWTLWLLYNAKFETHKWANNDGDKSHFAVNFRKIEKWVASFRESFKLVFNVDCIALVEVDWSFIKIFKRNTFFDKVSLYFLTMLQDIYYSVNKKSFCILFFNMCYIFFTYFSICFPILFFTPTRLFLYSSKKNIFFWIWNCMKSSIFVTKKFVAKTKSINI